MEYLFRSSSCSKTFALPRGCSSIYASSCLFILKYLPIFMDPTHRERMGTASSLYPHVINTVSSCGDARWSSPHINEPRRTLERHAADMAEDAVMRNLWPKFSRGSLGRTLNLLYGTTRRALWDRWSWSSRL